MTEPGQYPLQDVDEPNLYRDQFPYTQLPRVRFEDATLELSPAPEIWTTDTTFRDGQQARPPYTVEQIVTLFKLMSRLDGGAGLIWQCAFFVSSKTDRHDVGGCLAAGLRQH